MTNFKGKARKEQKKGTRRGGNLMTKDEGEGKTGRRKGERIRMGMMTERGRKLRKKVGKEKRRGNRRGGKSIRKDEEEQQGGKRGRRKGERIRTGMMTEREEL